jgi:hypothetical protein
LPRHRQSFASRNRSPSFALLVIGSEVMNVLTADFTAQGSTSMKTKKADKTTASEAAHVADRGAHVAPAKAPAKKGTTRKKAAPRGQKNAKAPAPKKSAKAAKKMSKPGPAKKASTPHAGSKGGKILALIGGEGATLAEIMAATGWQAHSVRGYLSTAGKKQGIKIDSSKNEAGERTYKSA